MNSVDNRTLIKANIKDGNKRTNPILLNKLKKKIIFAVLDTSK